MIEFFKTLWLGFKFVGAIAIIVAIVVLLIAGGVILTDKYHWLVWVEAFAGVLLVMYFIGHIAKGPYY